MAFSCAIYFRVFASVGAFLTIYNNLSCHFNIILVVCAHLCPISRLLLSAFKGWGVQLGDSVVFWTANQLQLNLLFPFKILKQAISETILGQEIDVKRLNLRRYDLRFHLIITIY